MTLLLFVGRLAPNKRVPVLVEALSHLRDLSPPVHAVIIGDTGDVYADEAERCRQRAAELGVSDRLHLLGHVAAEQLRDAYRSADLFIMPSRHEGFCIPVIEALASGLPVIAARAGALPETVGPAGLTFTPDDPADLARQVRRVLATGEATQPPKSLRVAVVSYRFGHDFVGGAETSLRTIAQALARAEHQVEVFTTCAHSEGDWSNHHPEGMVHIDGLPVHRFAIAPHQRERFVRAQQALQHGPVGAEAEREYLEASIHSPGLMEAIRRGSFDAIIAGPYGNGLTHDVARAFPEQTLVLPCFHDESLARLAVWREAYEAVGGLLYHTPEEQDFAEWALGINHPRAFCCGTYLDAKTPGDPQRGRERVGGDRPYIVYCGRYSVEKDLPALLECAERYDREHPGRFTFVFLGAGGVSIPRAPWARDLGFVSEAAKRDILAGAAALVQLSRRESLSLAALEAWAQGVPVIADARCTVLAGHIDRSQGGRAVGDTNGLADALDDLWSRPEEWRQRGQQGQQYVRQHYGSPLALADRLVEAITALRVPLADSMRRRGRQRAELFERSRWRQQFADRIEALLDRPARPVRAALEVIPRSEERTVSTGLASVLVPVRITNRGTHPALAEGPARVRLSCMVSDASGQPCADVSQVALPALLMPGQSLAAALPVPVPALPGQYRVAFEAVHDQPLAERMITTMTLVVAGTEQRGEDHCCTPMLDLVYHTLAEADRLQRLPVDYVDVTLGWFARAKRWAKQKLLGNFKRAYVDVLSRQQSDFNQQVLGALRELAECCATLDHAGRVAEELAESRARCRALEARVQRLERLLAVRQPRDAA